MKNSISENIGADLAAGLVVFLVAVPLCLGIALASGAPLFAGIIAGIVGGIVVGFVSKSNLSVSGPAAGLTAIVLGAITQLGSFELFLCATVIAGALQIALGFLKAGNIGNYFPSNVIEGMLAAIGIIIILKQIPHAIGFDKDYEGDFSFIEPGGGNTFSALIEAFNFVTPGAVIIALVSVAILLTWERIPALKNFKFLPAALVAVVVSVLLNEIFARTSPALTIQPEHLVNLPVPESLAGFFSQFTFPNFSGLASVQVWTVGATIAAVASIETLLCIEATDRLDPHKRHTPTSHELKAQGVGNLVSGLIGGLPMTSVIIRSSANVNSGAQTKLSAITHGVLLLISVAAIPFLLNKIPLATLAAILLLTGYKLARPAIFRRMWRDGYYQFIPFVVTIAAVVFTDLLSGVALGLAVSIFFLLRENTNVPFFFRRQEYKSGEIIHIHLAQEVSFLNKAAIKKALASFPDDGYVILDATETAYIDHDVREIIKEFAEINAPDRGIRVDLVGFDGESGIENTLAKQPVDLLAAPDNQQVLSFKPKQTAQELFDDIIPETENSPKASTI